MWDSARDARGEEIQHKAEQPHGCPGGFHVLPPPPEGPFRHSSVFHGILERFVLERSLKPISFHTRLFRAPSSLALGTFRDSAKARDGFYVEKIGSLQTDSLACTLWMLPRVTYRELSVVSAATVRRVPVATDKPRNAQHPPNTLRHPRSPIHSAQPGAGTGDPARIAVRRGRAEPGPSAEPGRSALTR